MNETPDPEPRPGAGPSDSGPGPEAGRPSSEPAAPRSEPLIPDVLEPGEDPYGSRPGGIPFGGGPGGMFEPRSFGGGRVQVFGCSPGCLVLSLVVSVVLSVVLTLLLNLIFWRGTCGDGGRTQDPPLRERAYVRGTVMRP